MRNVAERAGVSVASVSRLINGTTIRPELKTQILQAIVDLDFQPNYAARVLKVRKTNQISVSFADIGNPAYVSITRGISDVLKINDYRLVLSDSMSSSKEIVRHINSLQTGYADGLIIAPIIRTNEISDALSNLRIPAIIIGSLPPRLELDNIEIDSQKGIELAIHKFICSKRKRIGFLGGPITTNPGFKRHASFRQEMKNQKLDLDESRIYLAEDFTSDCANALISKCKNIDFDALLCANDLLAAGAILSLAKKGFTIPKDIAVIGMDNTGLCDLITPTLTSIDLKAEERGRQAAKMLLDRISDPNCPSKRVKLLPELVERNSA